MELGEFREKCVEVRFFFSGFVGNWGGGLMDLVLF